MNRNTMTEGTPWKHIVRFAMPVLAGSLLQQLYNTVDAIVVGKFAGEGKVEYKLRRESEHELLTIEDAIAKAKALVDLEGDGRYFFHRLSEETMNAH